MTACDDGDADSCEMEMSTPPPPRPAGKLDVGGGRDGRTIPSPQVSDRALHRIISDLQIG